MPSHGLIVTVSLWLNLATHFGTGLRLPCSKYSCTLVFLLHLKTIGYWRHSTLSAFHVNMCSAFGPPPVLILFLSKFVSCSTFIQLHCYYVLFV